MNNHLFIIKENIWLLVVCDIGFKIFNSRRAVSPIIATLLLVAIAVIGGTIVFIFSNGFFSQAQVSGTPTIESLEITGYDARDTENLVMHDGLVLSNIGGVASGDGFNAGDRIAVYLQNNGVQKFNLKEIRFAGTIYNYTAVNNIPPPVVSTSGEFYIILEGIASGGLNEPTPALNPGQEASIVLSLAENLKSGRDSQLKITSSNGVVFVKTVITGN